MRWSTLEVEPVTVVEDELRCWAARGAAAVGELYTCWTNVLVR